MKLHLALAGSSAQMADLHGAAFETGWSKETFQSLIEMSGVFALVDEPMKGLILVRLVCDEGEVLTVAVAADARRQGLGRCLVQAAAQTAAARGVRTLFLEVAADNSSAINLYRGEGFEAAGLRRGYYSRSDGHGVDALVFKKALTAPT